MKLGGAIFGMNAGVTGAAAARRTIPVIPTIKGGKLNSRISKHPKPITRQPRNNKIASNTTLAHHQGFESVDTPFKRMLG